MSFDIFISFDGNCKEAIEFYAEVFNSEVQNMMTYSEMPEDPNYKVPEIDRNKITYACVPIYGCNVMFMDMPSDMPLIIGNNISPIISISNFKEIEQIFNKLKDGGKVEMDLQKTFWSDLYGMVTDKYGVIWQINYYNVNSK